MNRTRIFISLVAFAILQTTPSLIAQQFGYRANVPFDFSVDNRTMPAGDYLISRQGKFLLISNNSSQVFVVPIGANPSHDGHNKLVFDSVNGTCFLRKLETQSSETSIQLPASRAERKALAERQFAANTPVETRTVNLPNGAQ